MYQTTATETQGVLTVPIATETQGVLTVPIATETQEVLTVPDYSHRDTGGTNCT